MNLGWVSFIIRERSLSKNMHPRERAARFIENRLDLTMEQKEEFERLRVEHFENIRPKIEQLKENKSRMLELVQSENDQVSIEEIARENGKLHEEIELINYQHFKKIREVCTEEQAEKLGHLFKRIMDSGLPGGPGPGRKGRHGR
jgi:Spy/CpxP family protein refolding chaperone